MLIPTCVIKLMELTLAVACLVLHQYSYDLTDLPTLMLCSGTYIGYVVVISGEIVGEMIFAPLEVVQDMYFAIVGATMFSMSGGMVLSARLKDSPFPRTGEHLAAMVAGSLAVLNGFIMLFDLILAYLDSEEFDDDASETISSSTDAYVDAWWSANGGFLFGACGALTLNNWRSIPACIRKTYAQAAAICALAAAAVFIVDAILAMCSANKDETSSRTKSHR